MDTTRKPKASDEYCVRMLFITTDDDVEKTFKDYNKACAYFEGCIDALCHSTRVASVSIKNESTNELIVRTGVNYEHSHWTTEGYAAYVDDDGFKNYDLDLYKLRFI